MPEWWSYSLSDFLLFSPRTYYRLVGRYNAAVWPAHLATAALGLVILFLLRQQSIRRRAGMFGVLALLWAWIAWAFLWKRYAEINWVAVYFLPLFALEVLLLGWAARVKEELQLQENARAAYLIAVALVLGALLGYPALALLAGRPWHQSEVFGIAPDPTAIATLGVVALPTGRVQWELVPVPVLWCVFSGLTLWAMESPEAWVPPSAAALAVLVALWRSLRHSSERRQQAGTPIPPRT
ncbi:MAG TPA: DUF6064 family protein [Gemmatimonadales bacterium]|nr:DUF6064 family protein [Gemmatimonadales bacterium]